MAGGFGSLVSFLEIVVKNGPELRAQLDGVLWWASMIREVGRLALRIHGQKRRRVRRSVVLLDPPRRFPNVGRFGQAFIPNANYYIRTARRVLNHSESIISL